MEVTALVNEKALLARLADDDSSAFAALFHHYKNRIYTVALRLSHSQSLAEEIVQDVFTKVWLKRAELTGIENFQGWLFTVSRNQLYSALRYQASHPTIPLNGEEYLPVTAAAESNLTEKEYKQLLASAIATLSPAQREVYHMIKEEGLKREEVASRLGISVNTVKTHLQRAMTEIRTYCLSRLPAAIVLVILHGWK